MRHFCLCAVLALTAIGLVTPAVAAERDPIVVPTFNREFINWATPHEAVFTFPPAQLYTQVECQMAIACPAAPGDCDPWDRFGNLVLRHEENGVVTDYEIARFITPYDITFSGGPQICSWTIDVTDYAFLLHDDVTLRLYIESWMGDNRGWLMTINFAMTPGVPEREAFAITKLWSHGSLVYGDPDNPWQDHLMPVEVAVPEQATWARFRAFATGHGFYNTDNAAEFSVKWQGLSVDDDYTQHYLWRSDCAANRCSPQLGTWQYNRAGWCPGDKSEAWNVDVSDWVVPGQPSEFGFSLQPYENVCRPNNPDCVDGTGCECAGHAYYKFEGQVVFYRIPTTTAVDATTPAVLHLVGNHPNPFNPETTVRYHLAEPGRVEIAIYDATGAVVFTTTREHAAAGGQEFTWNGRDERGRLLASGMYVYEIRHGQERVSAKMLMLR